MKQKPIILVVDDQPSNSELMEAYLGSENYEILTTNDGKKALEILSNNQIDLILLDVLMPEANGFEVTRRIEKISS